MSYQLNNGRSGKSSLRWHCEHGVFVFASEFLGTLTEWVAEYVTGLLTIGYSILLTNSCRTVWCQAQTATGPESVGSMHTFSRPATSSWSIRKEWIHAINSEENWKATKSSVGHTFCHNILLWILKYWPLWVAINWGEMQSLRSSHSRPRWHACLTLLTLLRSAPRPKEQALQTVWLRTLHRWLEVRICLVFWLLLA